MAEHTSTDEGEDTARHQMLIEGEAHDWHKGTITVDEIRELGGLSTDRPVVRVDLQTNDRVVMDDDEVHELPELDPGKGVSKRVNFASG